MATSKTDKKTNDELTEEQVGILDHTIHRAACGLYCGDGPDMQVLVKKGMMQMAGRKTFVPDPYFRITGKGKAALAAHEVKGA